MSDPSAEDYPVTWGGVLLCCTYTSVIAFRFLLDALICPPLRALSVSWGFLVGLMRAYPAVFMAPLILMWKVLALARRRWRMLTWRHQALYISGILIYFACCVLRVGLWLVTWIGHWPWWFAPDTCVLYMATLLPVAVPSVAATGRLVSRLGLRAVLTLRDIGDRPVLLPIVCRPVPKVWIWKAHVQLAHFYRASLPRQLLQCCACYGLIISSGLVKTSPTTLTSLVYEGMLSVTERHLPGPAHVPHHGEDAHVARCTTRNTPRFIPDVKRGKVTAVYDGDTVTVAARHSRQGIPYRFSVRLSGIDAPEIRGSTSAEEKQAAIAARDALRAAILGELVTLTVSSFDKYGRLLAAVAHDHRGDMSQWMLKAGYARPYDGGKRETWEIDL